MSEGEPGYANNEWREVAKRARRSRKKRRHFQMISEEERLIELEIWMTDYRNRMLRQDTLGSDGLWFACAWELLNLAKGSMNRIKLLEAARLPDGKHPCE